MTGYGKAQSTIASFELTVEIKSVNNRYMDIIFRMPIAFSSFEPQLRKRVKENINRGKVSIFVDLKEAGQSQNGSAINEDRLLQRYETLKAIKHKLNIPGEIELSHLLHFEELFEVDTTSIDEDKMFNQLETTLKEALVIFNAMRSREGEHLIEDMKQRIALISSVLQDVKLLAKDSVREEFDKLSIRIEELLDTKKIDKDKLEQEIALISDKVDITEEITRFESHLGQFNQTLKKDAELGKKLTFILQEMHREANTINSKTTNVEIAHKIIQVKEEIEKIREQTQNIE